MGKISLYEHNRNAYEKVKQQLAEYGKTCVIHPTGTGKSYIGFALIDNNPDKRFLWISPSKYIYRLQVENLRKQQNITFANVVFHTYNWIMDHVDMIEELKPDYIILDEFHRAGALHWSIGIKALTYYYPKAGLLGLTATNIRYLDSHRDMAKELFDNRIASEMSLPEAMAKRILPVPKYVISTYTYKEKMNYYNKRVGSTSNNKRKKECVTILEKLKHKLDNAVGLEQIFAKHIKNRKGKYIVFCAKITHMFDMMTQVPVWFEYIDRRPHIYHVYSENPKSTKDFERFMNDDTPHLKLLFVIDMLNEGIHVSGIDGVVLLRATTSPIVYKQQIGRALATGGVKTPIIFDLVNNFDSLYNISTLKEEFDSFVALQNEGTLPKDYKGRFEIVDELRDCRELFEQLHKNLNFGWDEYYNSLREYKNKHGNVKVAKRYTDSQGLYVGRWLIRQRAMYREGHLTTEQVDRLEELGISWKKVLDERFEKWFELLCKYREEYGDVYVPSEYVTPDGKALGNWCNGMRQRYRMGRMIPERIQRFEAIGFDWYPFGQYWREGYKHAKEYYEQYGNLNAAKKFICNDGYRLGYWLITQRNVRAGKTRGILNERQIGLLDELGMVWDSKKVDLFDEFLEAYKSYAEDNDGKRMPSNYVTADGYAVGQWTGRMRMLKKQGKLSKYKEKRLDEAGFDWSVALSGWERQYNRAKAYYEENGNLDITEDYIRKNGSGITEWFGTIRTEYAKEGHGTLTETQIEKLKEIGFEFRSHSEVLWQQGVEELKKYIELFGDTLVPSAYCSDNGHNLGKWINHVKKDMRNGRLKPERIEELNRLGMYWGNIETLKAEKFWDTMYEEAKAYYEKNGNLNVPHNYVTEKGNKLSQWLHQQRRIKRGSIKHSITYTDERIAMMDSIGMNWNEIYIDKK